MLGSPSGSGGVFSGAGVTDIGDGINFTFNPAIAGVGSHSITYTFTDANGCANSASDNIQVFAIPTVAFTAPADLCLNTGVQNNLGGGTPTGGTYSGPGVYDDGNGMTFDFDPAMAGVGTHAILYSFTDANGCTNSDSDDIQVFALPVVSFSAPADLCVDAGIQSGLTGGAPVGGTYSGPGVMDSGDGMTYSFNPATAGVGTPTITYLFSDTNGCSNSASDGLEVFALPVVTFTAPADLCIDEGVQNNLGSGIPTGGTYSGPGVTDNGNGMTYSFDPASASVGIHTITYSFTDVNGCTNTSTDNIEIFSLPIVSFSNPTDLCINSGVQTGLSGGSPAGGIYSGTGVTDNGNGMTYNFDPAMAGIGMHTITYTFTDGNSCTNAASENVEVWDIPVVNFMAPAPEVCIEDAVVTGLGGGTPTGGVYSGSGVADDGNGTTFSFDPTASAPAGGNVSITYTFTDANGCTGTSNGTIFVDPICCELMVDCSAVSDQNLECLSDIPPVDNSLVIISEACGQATISAQTDPIPANSGCPGNSVSISRTYSVQDEDGNMDACTQTFTIESTQSPSITCPANTTISCDADSSPANTGMATGTASCSDFNLNITFSDVSTQGTGCSEFQYIISRTWTATDNCNRIATCIQTITIEDNTPPTITCPANVTIECDDPSDPTATGSATASGDNCSPDAQLTVTFSDNSTQTANGCGNMNYTISRTWTASDPCGNTATCVQTITVEDNTPPTVTCPVNVTIECDDPSDPTATGTATASGDNCSPDAQLTVTFSDISTQTANGCGNMNYTISRTWTASDPCGNTATCIQTITVEDNTPPMIICPPVVSIECDEDTSSANTGMATATDNCSGASDITIIFSDVSTQTTSGCGQYEYNINRTWIATDNCGNATNCVQRIIVGDTQGPNITCPPNINGLVCNTDPLPDAQSVTDFLAIGGSISDNCSSLTEISVSYVDSPPNQSMLDFCSSDPADRTLTRTYTVTDICGNTSVCSQTFSYLQSIVGPIITSIPLDQTVDCEVNAFPQPHLFQYEIDCGLGATTTVSGPITNGTTGCPGSSISYTYTVTDICGRTASHIQTYTLINEGPEFVCPVDICVIECPADTDMIQNTFDNYANLATVINSCNSSSTITNDFSANGFNLQNCNNGPVAVANAVAWQIVTFTATDQCGRIGSCTALVVIKDTDGPVISSTPTDAIRLFDANAQASYETWANNNIANFIAEDECNGFTSNSVSWSYTPAVPNTTFVGPFATTIVSFIATDDCGNTTSVSATFRLKEVPSSSATTISGTIQTEENELVEAVEIALDMNGLGEGEIQITEENGAYEFTVELEQNYEVVPSRLGDILNGITTIDLILMGQHLLEIQTLDSPYRIIAADINRSGSITALDMIELRRLILLIADDYTNNTSWRFVDAEYIFPNPENPFAATFPEVHNINNLTQAEVADFIAIKIGDLNGSAQVNALASTGDTRDRNTLNFKVDNQELFSGETYSVDFRASDFKDLLGYQFTLEYDPNQLTFVDIQQGQLQDLSMDNFGIKQDQGAITSSWNTTVARSLPDDAILFSINFKANQDVQLGEAILINSRLTEAEAYTKEFESMNLELSFDDITNIFSEFKLYQNQPNPFKSETVIGFSLPESSKATLKIYDVTGRIVKQITDNYTKGYHQLIIDGAELSSVGLLYYQLETATNMATQKMIKQ